jgi:hypothetical protein
VLPIFPAAEEISMKRDHVQTTRPRRPRAQVAAVLVTAGCGLLGLRLGMDATDSSMADDPAVRPSFHEPVPPTSRRPSGAPDHALLSARDVERALPPALRAQQLTEVGTS